MKKFRKLLASGKNAAFVIRKGALSYDEKMNYGNENRMTRENIIRHIVKYPVKIP